MQARATVDAQDGHRGAGTKAEHDEAGAGPQDLSLSVAQHDDRAVLAWRLSNTMDVSFCVAALDEALAKYGTPEIFNTDQGCQFTSATFTGALAGAGIKISMDGRGRWMDNVFIERLWRSLKHEDIDLKGYADGREAKAGVASWITFYNNPRLHQVHGDRTPAVWRERMQAAKAVDMVDNANALTTCPSVDAPVDARRLFRLGVARSRVLTSVRPLMRPSFVAGGCPDRC
ncbi:hypothetical protein AB7M56_000188 [Bradyrhizobium elkanii]|nr:hypothetical protein [Bradyrhizobium elkanii]MCS3525005.1 hypothetical protein [Bradyrhizobium elkanii]MCS4075783.1 hypothetical protein [Bradyrhizobium elkanii]MCS4084968.1 hypothetical protein [Bradyrhizobium elkanii]MCS4112645.1 hypothetical protein [Bradyrhizobium elkanii]